MKLKKLSWFLNKMAKLSYIWILSLTKLGETEPRRWHKKNGNHLGDRKGLGGSCKWENTVTHSAEDSCMPPWGQARETFWLQTFLFTLPWEEHCPARPHFRAENSNNKHQPQRAGYLLLHTTQSSECGEQIQTGEAGKTGFWNCKEKNPHPYLLWWNLRRSETEYSKGKNSWVIKK